MNDDFGTAYIEYGIQMIEYQRPFPKMTEEEAKKVCDNYWDTSDKEY